MFMLSHKRGRSSTDIVATACRVAFCACATFAVASHAHAQQAPRTLMLRGDALVTAQQRVRNRDAALQPAVDRLRKDADRALAAPLIAVTDKRTVLPPSKDAHDYYSLSPYWWPDPAKPDGLPYIRRDGETNPESKRDLDQPRLASMSDNVQSLTLAWWFTGESKYAEQAAKQLRTWFIDPATRMTPQLRYAQLVRGNDKERGSGIIDSRGFLDVLDAVILLEQSSVWTQTDDKAVRSWFADYLAWLRTSPNGRTEKDARNNHGSWFAAQTSAYALFSGDTTLARAIVTGVQERIGWQIQSDGKQPEELLRTRSYHYSNFNIDALSRIAEMARWVGLELWRYQAPSGGSLVVAIDRLAPFVDRQQEWPDAQLDPVKPDLLLDTFLKARLALGDAKGESTYDGVIARLPAKVAAADRSLLLYATPAGRK